MSKQRKILDAAKKTLDSFNNWASQLGYGTANQQTASTYAFNYLTRNRQLLEASYRGSWIVGQAVDAPAEDMTRAGIEIESTMPPEECDEIYAELMEKDVWGQLCENTKWSRLFGGSIAVMLIDGQDYSTPLNIDAIGKDQFKGLLVLDRWLVQPTISDLITDLGPDFGKPKFYEVIADAGTLPNMKIHHSRVIRQEGLDLPYYQRRAENGWGESVIERIYDRLLAFDSTTMGAAQLVFKAHLRTMKVKGLRDIVAIGGEALSGLNKQLEMIRLFQTNEGLTLMDGEDEFETHTYSFAGLDVLLLRFSEQLSGALQVPLVRLLGQSPGGLSSSGESDLRTYYDHINKTQEAQFRRPLGVLLQVVARSRLGKAPPDGFNYRFRPLWQTPDETKATMAQSNTASIAEAFDKGLVSQQIALKELRQQSHTTGMWSNITDEDIEAADDEVPDASELMAQANGEGGENEPVSEGKGDGA